MVNTGKRSDMFIFMIPECKILSSIASVFIWSIAVAAVLVNFVALYIKSKNVL